jgi:hypothetical protein
MLRGLLRGRSRAPSRTRGKGSGVEVVQQTFWVYTLRGGQIVHAKVLVDKSQALEAAGLRE